MKDYIIIVIIVGFFMAFALISISKDEIIECNKLLEQSREYPSFWSTQADKDMCQAHGIIIK